MSSKEPFSLPQAIGDQLRRLRLDRYDLRQEDIAARAQALGLDWTRPTVTAIESGQRSLSIAELFRLPSIYPGVRLTDLFPHDDTPVEFGSLPGPLGVNLRVTMSRSQVADLLQRVHDILKQRAVQFVETQVAPVEGKVLEVPAEGEVSAEVETSVGGKVLEVLAEGLWQEVLLTDTATGKDELKLTVEHTKVVGEWDDQAAERVYLELPWNIQERRSEIEVAAKGDAERKAAHRLGVSALLVSVVAFKQYHQSLSHERDLRTSERLRIDRVGDLRTGQAIRGHVTRTLLAEMKNKIEYYKAKR
jgi:hypothetical protein